MPRPSLAGREWGEEPDESGEMPPPSAEYVQEGKRLAALRWTPRPLVHEDEVPLCKDPEGMDQIWVQAFHEFPDDTRARRLLLLKLAGRTLTEPQESDLQLRVERSAGSSGHAGFPLPRP